MSYFVFLVLLLSTSTPVVDALSCATNCSFTGTIGTATPPASCNFVDKPASEHSCQMVLTIDYMTGAVNGILNARTPAIPPNFDAVTVFSLANEAVNLTLEFDCLDSNKCDLTFAADVLKSDWSVLQNKVKLLRAYLSEMLFNTTDLRPTATCPVNQTYSGEGFVRTIYQVWSDVPTPTYQGVCSNSTDQPLLDWVEAYDQKKTGILMIYTCNTPLCGTPSSALNITREIAHDYILPFNVTMPATSTVAPATSAETSVSTASASASILSTTITAASTAHAAFLDKLVQVTSIFASVLFLHFS